MRLGELISGTGAEPLTEGWESVRICDITEDSRTAVPGSLFVARAGLKADGRKYIDDALRAGAVAVLTDDASGIGAGQGALPGAAAVPGWEPAHGGGHGDWAPAIIRAVDLPAMSGLLAERFYGRPSGRLDTIAVTGTNGKSTITFLVWKILNGVGTRCGLIGTVITDDGREVAASSMTTPPAIEVSRLLGSMVEGGCTAAVMEASSHALDQKRVDAVELDVAVFTNLTGDHLDYHKTMEAYAAAKSRLLALLPASGLAVVNADDPWHEKIARGCRAPVLRCRVAAEDRAPGAGCASACVQASGTDGMRLVLAGPWGRIEASVPLIGRYNVMNVLQAVACCHAIGVGAEDIARVLPGIGAPPGRLERVSVKGVAGPKVYVDYAHSDDSLRNVLTAVRGAMREDPAAGRLWVVFGCGGDKDRTKRPRMGLAAAELADEVVVTSDNPRSEHPGVIVKEVLAGIPASLRSKVEVHVEREQAIAAAVLKAAENDIVVIAGKGHETEQIRMDSGGQMVTLHFDDREHAAARLRGRAASEGSVV